MDELKKRKIIFVLITLVAIALGAVIIIFSPKLTTIGNNSSQSAIATGSAASVPPGTSGAGSVNGSSASSKALYTELSSSELPKNSSQPTEYKASLAKDGFTYPEKADNAAFAKNSTLSNPLGLNHSANIKVDADNTKGILADLTATDVKTGKDAQTIMQAYDKAGVYGYKNATADLDYAVITCKLNAKVKAGTGVNYTYSLKPYVCQAKVNPMFWKFNMLNSKIVDFNAVAVSDATYQGKGDATTYKILCLIPKTGGYYICMNYGGNADPCAVINPLKK